MACLDTTVLIDLMRGSAAHSSKAAAVVQSLGRSSRLSTTRLNVAELEVGIHRSANPVAARRQAERVLAPLIVLEFDEAAAALYGAITAALQGMGRPAGDMDVLIAAVAMTHGQPLVTRNAKHFRDIPALQVVEYG